MLELKGVKKIYNTKSGPVYALNGVDLVFPSTGMVFVVGKSGCGKTTLLNVIGGLDGVDEGEISVLGRSFSDFSASDYDGYRNTFIGFIFQEYNLLPEYTVEKNIKMAMELQGSTVDDLEYEELLHTVEIQDLRNRKPGELSGGQRQRVAIARALIKKPRIIMADEPTGALDSNTGTQVFDILKKLSKEKLVIVVSHDLESAEKYADRIVRLVDGNVVEDSVYTDTEILSNLKEDETSLVIKEGADLDEREKNIVASAIKNKKKLEVIENLTFREKHETGEVQGVVSEQPVVLKKSRMKLKSTFSMSVKSLTVKPFRLIVTILLSAMAFAVFGLFDTVANFSNAKVIKNLLQTFTSPTVVASAQYVPEGIASNRYNVKLSDDTINQLQQDTGYDIKGIFDFKDNVAGVVDRNYEITNFIVYNTKNYYSNKIDGLVEVSSQEIENNPENPFGFNLISGRCPKLQYTSATGVATNASMHEIAISKFTAESIVYFLNGENLSGNVITNIHDLVGNRININGEEYTIVGIVDLGDIPEKYLALRDGESVENASMLSSDFETYLSSGAHRCLFVGKGYLKALNQEFNGANVYYTGRTNWQVQLTGLARVANMQAYVYSPKNYDSKNVLTFSGQYDNNGKPILADDEVLVHPQNLLDLYKEAIRDLSYQDRTDARTCIEEIMVATTGDNNVRTLLNKFMNYVNAGNSRSVDISYPSQKDGKIVRKTIKIVGVYYGIDRDRMPGESTYRFMMTDNLMQEFNICTDQGEYNRVLLGGSGSSKGRTIISNLMVSEDGYRLDWYGNSALQTIEENAQTVRQTADLFLYVAIILASFSIFMFFNYIATSIVNKRPSIGVLRGLGSGGKDIFRMFTGESLIIAIINAILAVAISALGCVFVNMYIRNIMNITISFAIFGLRQVLIIFAMSIITAIISSILPIIKIAKEKPVDLIRKL